MIALVRYQFALLIRSHRWIPPAVLFVAGVAGLASGGPALGHGVGLSQGFAWFALGLAAALVCLLVGSAIGALFNPPLIRRPAAAMLCATGAVVLALAWSGSPANAEVRSVGYGAQEATWPTGLALFAAIALIAVAWAVSAQVAARRQA